MIQTNDIKDIMQTMRSEYPDVNERDIAYVILSQEIADKKMSFCLAYGAVLDIAETYEATPKIAKLKTLLEPYGIGANKDSKITKDQNTTQMLRLLADIKRARENGELDAKDALNMEKDIRAKLQDKFDIGESKDTKRIIIVPQKHDIICPHTQRECSSMPSKEACIKYYHLDDGIDNEDEDNNNL